MASKTLVTIILGGIIASGLFAGGTLLRKANNSRSEVNYRNLARAGVFAKVSDLDGNGEMSNEEERRTYCIIKGHYRTGKDPQLTEDEMERYISNNGFFWNEAKRAYEYQEPPKLQPSPQPTPKDYKRSQDYTKKK